MYRVDVARTIDELERLEQIWRSVRWTGEQAEHPLFLAAARARSRLGRPFALLVSGGDDTVAAAAGRIESRRLETRLGYLPVFAPELRILQLVPGGVVAEDDDARTELVSQLESTLAEGEIDALAVPALPIQSELYRALAELGGWRRQQHFVPSWTRRRLLLPASFDEFLASRTRKIRAGIRYDTKKLVEAFVERLSVEIFRDDTDFDRLVRDMDAVAAATYQRALGAGFTDTPERRTMLRIALQNGWSRAYVLHLDGRPAAYWLCSAHRETMTLGATGYLPDYAQYRVGIYLLMRVIEDACRDSALRVLDFGPGRSAYKRHFSSEGYEERNLLIFAPTLRAQLINTGRSTVLGTALVARRALDATGLTDRLKTGWRRRLREGAA